MAKTPYPPALYCGLDIGGTKLLAVITDANGTILGEAKKKTKAQRGFDTVMERCEDTVREACEAAHLPIDELDAIGVGAPSPILEDGTAVNAPNMKWFNVPLVKTLSNRLGCPVFAENDCNAGTLGEYALGGAQGSKSAVGLFVGTGLGGGYIHRGELVIGENRQAAEWGHMIVQVNGRKCGCGHNGCLEAYASKTGMARKLAWEITHQGRESLLFDLCEKNLTSIRSSVLKEAYQKKDALTVECLHEMADYLGVGIANIITAIGPDCVVVGGGVFEALGKELLPRVCSMAERCTHPPVSFKDTRIVLAKLGDHAVAMGAMVYAREQMNSR